MNKDSLQTIMTVDYFQTRKKLNTCEFMLEEQFKRDEGDVCRICLERCEIKKIFCACSGSHSCHQQCLLQYLRKKYELKPEELLVCEICKQLYQLQQREVMILSCQYAWVTIQTHQLRIWLYISFFALSLMYYIFAVILYTQNLLQNYYTIITILCITIGVLLILAIIRFLYDFCLIINKILTGVRENSKFCLKYNNPKRVNKMSQLQTIEFGVNKISNMSNNVFDTE